MTRWRWARAFVVVSALLVLAAGCARNEGRYKVAGTGRQTAGEAAAIGSGAGDAAVAADAPGGSIESGDTSVAGPTSAGSSGARQRSTTSDVAGVRGTSDRPSGPVPSAAGGVTTGVTNSTITVSFLSGFGGPYGQVFEEYYKGVLTWRDDVNARGGINGRKIVLRKVDHKDSSPGGVGACKEVLSNGSFTAVITEGDDATISATDCLDRAGFDHLTVPFTFDSRWRHAYANFPTGDVQGGSLATFARARLGGATKKIGVLYVNSTAYKHGAGGFIRKAKALGLNVAAVDIVEPNQASFTSQMLRMKNAGVEIVVVSATIELIGIVRDAHAIAYRPAFTGLVFSFDWLSHAGGNLLDGVTGLRFYTTADTPAFAEYHKKAVATGHSGLTDSDGLAFYGGALVLDEGLRRAGSNPTRASLERGLQSMKNYDNGVLAPITWGPGKLLGATGSFPVICCNPDSTWRGLGPARSEF